MRKIISLLIMLLGGAVVYVLGPVLFDPCGKPVKYALGNIDPRFGASAEQVMAATKNAEAIWENAAQRNLLEFDPDAKLKINLVFDERQERFLEGESLGKQFDFVKSVQSGISKEYDSAASQYNAKKAEYQELMAKYEKGLKAYNQKVDRSNRQGGASPEEYNLLQKEAESLEKLREGIEVRRDEVNTLAGKLKRLSGKEKQAVEAYNEQVLTYRETYGEAKEFDQGLYAGDRIDVYQFQNSFDLTLVLAHEFGHALGIGHVEGETSLMYPLMGAQDVGHPKLSPEDRSALQVRCERGWPGAWHVFRDRLQTFSQDWLSGRSGV